MQRVSAGRGEGEGHKSGESGFAGEASGTGTHKQQDQLRICLSFTMGCPCCMGPNTDLIHVPMHAAMHGVPVCAKSWGGSALVWQLPTLAPIEASA